MTEQQIALHVEELNLRIEVLEDQRNKALTEAVAARAQLGLARQRVAALEKQLADLTQPKGQATLVT